MSIVNSTKQRDVDLKYDLVLGYDSKQLDPFNRYITIHLHFTFCGLEVAKRERKKDYKKRSDMVVYLVICTSIA